MTEIDDITQQLARAAGQALQAARVAKDRGNQRSLREREEARREREHRLRMFEEQMRATILQRRLAGREGNQQLVDDLAEIEHQQRTRELISRWAAAEAHREADPGLADAWTARLREAGIDHDTARAYADELGSDPKDPDAARHDKDELDSGPQNPDDLLDSEQLAVDYTDMATDFSDARMGTPSGRDTAATSDGAEAARLIDIAHPQTHSIGPVKASPIPINVPGPMLDLEHVSQL